MTNIFITGIAGLIGSNFAHWIKQNTNNKIFGIDDLSGGRLDNLRSDNNDLVVDDLIVGNIINYNLTEYFQVNKIDLVYHFAAYAAECLSPFIRKYNYTNNVLASSEIINACINSTVKRLVFTSSMAVYGRNQAPFREEQRPAPIDPYGIAKYSVEMDLAVAKEQHGLDYTIIRPHNYMGERQNIWDKYRNVFGIWMYNTLHNKPITIYGDGEQRRAISYVQNCLPLFYRSGTDKGLSEEIINIGGLKDHSINELADMYDKITGNKDRIYLEARHEVKHAYCDHSKSIKLGYEEKHSLEEGIYNMWEWAKKQPDLPRQEFKLPFEVEKGIYSYWKK